MDGPGENSRAAELVDELRGIFGETVPSQLVTEVALHIQRKVASASKRTGCGLGSDLPLPQVYSATSLKAFTDQVANDAGIFPEYWQDRSSRNHVILTAASDCATHFARPPVLLARVSSCAQTGQMLLTDATSSIPCFTAANKDNMSEAGCRSVCPHLTPGHVDAWLLIWRFRLIIEFKTHRPPAHQSCCLVNHGLGSMATVYIMFDACDVKRVLAPVRCQETLDAVPLTFGTEDPIEKCINAHGQQLLIPAMPCAVLAIGKESYKWRRHGSSRKVTFVLRLCTAVVCLPNSSDEKAQCADGLTKSFSVELVAEARKLMPFVHVGQCYVLRKVKKRGQNDSVPYGSALYIDDLTSLEESVGAGSLSCGIQLCTALSAAKVGNLSTCLARVTNIAEQPQHDRDQRHQEPCHFKRSRDDVVSGRSCGRRPGQLKQWADSPHWCVMLEDVEHNTFTAEAYIFIGCIARHVTGIVPGAIVLLSDFLCEETPADCTANCVLVSATVSSVDVQVCPPVDTRPLVKQLESATRQSADGWSSLPLTFVWTACVEETGASASALPFFIHGRLVHIISLSLLARCNKCNEILDDGQCCCTASCNMAGQSTVTVNAKLFGIFEDGSCEFFGYAYDSSVPTLLDLSNQTWAAVGSHVAQHGKVDINASRGCSGQHVDGLAGVLLRLVQSRTFGAHKQLTVQLMPRRLNSRLRQHTDAYMIPYKACLDAERRMWATHITRKHEMFMLKIIKVDEIQYVL